MYNDYQNQNDYNLQNYMDELAQYDNAFGNTEVSERSYAPMPDGKYLATIDKAELTRTRTSNMPMLKLTLRIIGPQFIDRLLWKNHVIKPENLKWIKQDLYTCGLGITRLSELPKCLDQLLDVRLEIQKKSKGDLENVYLNRKLDIDPFESKGSADDIPF